VLRFEVRGFGVDVSIIEPGLIKTNFAETSVATVAHEDGPYADFNRAVAATTAGVYKGPLAKLGGGPEAVAEVIEKAVTARRPRTRYKVTASARILMAQRAMMPDRLWDATVRSSFPRPGAS
jgi:short-subunit dehydrogenase